MSSRAVCWACVFSVLLVSPRALAGEADAISRAKLGVSIVLMEAPGAKTVPRPEEWLAVIQSSRAEYLIVIGVGQQASELREAATKAGLTVSEGAPKGAVSQPVAICNVTQPLVATLARAVAAGGSLLLEVTPPSEGTIPPGISTNLKRLGDWLKKNGMSIFGAERCPDGIRTAGAVTARGSKLYLHALNPAPTVELDGLGCTVKLATLLDGGNKRDVYQRAGHVVAEIPGPKRDADDTVVVLELDAPAKGLSGICQAPDGRIILPPAAATLHGKTIQYEKADERDYIGFWSDAEDWVSWDFESDREGLFAAEITIGCQPGQGGSEYEVAVGASKLRGVTADTGDWRTCRIELLGTLQVARGSNTLSVKCTRKAAGAVMNLKKMTLVPVMGKPGQ